MKYMMFVRTDSEPDTDLTDDVETWVADNDARGRRLDGDALAPTSATTTIRVRDGELLSDGRGGPGTACRPTRAAGS